MASSNVDVVLRLKNAREFDASAKRSSRRIGDFGDQSSRASRQADRLGKSSGRGRRGLLLMGRAARYGALALGGFAVVAGKKSVDAASNLDEQLNKTAVVFRGSEKDIHRWSKGLAMGFGVSRREALETAGTFGNMLVPMGNSRKRAGEMSKTLVQLGADMASFNNVSTEQAMGALSSGLAGESEPLRRLGVDIRDAALGEFALARGIKKSTSEMSSAEKSQLIYSKILADTGDAQGDVKRTAGSWANVQRRLAAVTEDLSAKLGRKLVPYLEKGGVWLAKFINQMDKGKGPGGQFRDVVEGIWQGVKPVAIWFGRAAKKIATFASEHPNLVKFAAGVAAIKLAVGRLGGGGFFGSQGRFGAGAFASGFKGGIGTYLGQKAAEKIATAYANRSKGPMRRAGTTMGTAAGTSAATATVATSSGGVIAASSKGGRLAGAFTRAGGMLGPLMAAAIAIPLLAELGKKIDQWQGTFTEDAYDKTGASDRQKEAGDKILGPVLDFVNPLDKGLVDLPGVPGVASGGPISRAMIPNGEDGLIGAREGEFMMRESAVRRIGIPKMRALNEGAPLAGVGEEGPEVIHRPRRASAVPLKPTFAGAGSFEITVRHQSVLDGRVVAEEVSKHRRLLGDAVARDDAAQRGRA